MAGIGDSWGTKEELLHPRGPDGRWIRKAGIAKGIIGRVLDFLANFRPRTFQSKQQSNQYLQNISHRAPRRFTQRDYVRLRTDLAGTNADLRDGVIDEPSTKTFVDMMDQHATELPDDVVLTRVVPVEAFGFDAQSAVGTDSQQNPGIRGLSGKLVADRGYFLSTIGGVQGAQPAGTVRMVIAAKKGTKVIVPSSTGSDSTIFMDRDQRLRVTKIQPDGAGGWIMYATTFQFSHRGTVTPISGPVGEGRRPSVERERDIRTQQREAQRITSARMKAPDEAAEEAEAARLRETAARVPPSAGRVEEERRRQAEAQQPPQPQQPPPPGTPPPRTEPIQARSIGGEPQPATGPGGAPQPQAPGAAPEAPAAPRRAVDLRLAVRDADIPAPAAGPNRKRFNDAYEGVISGKKDPIDAVRELDRDAADLDAAGDPDADNLRRLSDVIREQYGLERPAERGGQPSAPEAPSAPPPVPPPAKKAAKKAGAGRFTPEQEQALIDRAKRFRGNERNEEEQRIVREADQILAERRTPEAQATKALRAPAKKAAPAKALTFPSLQQREQDIKGLFGGKRPTNAQLRQMGEDNNLGFGPKEPRSEMILAILGARPSRGRQRGELTPEEVGGLERLRRQTKKTQAPQVESIRKRQAPELVRNELPEGEAAPAKKAAKKVAKKAAPEAPGGDLDKMTKKELVDVAVREGVDHATSKNKDQLKTDIRKMREIGEAAPESRVGREQQIMDRLGVKRKPTVAQLREFAKEQGLTVGPRDKRDDLIDKILAPSPRERAEALAGPGVLERMTPEGRAADIARLEAPAPAKKAAKAAVPEAAPGTAAGKITAGRLQPGMRILVDANGNPTNRKTGSRAITIESVGRTTGGRTGLGTAARRSRIRIVGRDENGNEVTVPGDASPSQTFIVAPEPGAAPAKKTAKVAAPKRITIGEARRLSAVDAIKANEVTGNESNSWKTILSRVDDGTWTVPRARKEAKDSARYWRDQAATVRRGGGRFDPERVEAAASRLEQAADKYDKLAEELTISQSVTKTDKFMGRPSAPVLRAEGPSGHPGDTGMARAMVPEEQERQVKLDRVRAYGTLGTEIDELVTNGASPRALTQRIRVRAKQQFIPDEDVADLLKAAEAGDNDRVRALARRLMDREGITQIGSTEDVVPLDRENHQALGNAGIPRDTSVVHIVRPGSRAKVDGDDILIDRATVEPATPEEVAEFERSRRRVPEGSVAGDRPQAPVDNAPRKRNFTEAWDAADLGGEGSPGRSMKEIRDGVASGKLTPEEGIRRMEDEIAFNKEDLAEVDATLRQQDLTDAQRTRLQSDAAKLQNGIEAQERASKFMRLYFQDEKPTVKEVQVSLDAEGLRALQEATPDDLREAAKMQGLDPPKGETKDEILQDLVRQVAGKVARERGIIPKKRPAKKVAKKAAPEAPKISPDRERVDARLLAEGLDVEPGMLDLVQRALDGERIGGTPKNPTPRQIAEVVDGHARAQSSSTTIRFGNWDSDRGILGEKRDPEQREEMRRKWEDGMAKSQALKDLAERLRGIRRRPAKKAPAKAAPEVKAAEARADTVEARLINEHLEQLNGAKTREKAQEALDGLTMPELRRIGEQMGIKGRSKQDLRDKIVDRVKPRVGPAGIFSDDPGIRRQAGEAIEAARPQAFKRIGARAKEAGIESPSLPFSGVNDAEGEANRMFQRGDSNTEVARMLRERAAQVAKADLNEEGRRFRVEQDRDTLRAARKANAEYLRRLATMLQQEDKKQRPTKKAAPEPPTPPAKKAAPARPALSVVRGEGKGGGRAVAPAEGSRRLTVVPEPGAKSTTPEIPNNWGALGTGGEVEFHADGVIGQGLERMRDDRLIDVDGEPLSNVVGKLATRAVRGQISQQQLIDELKRLEQRLPQGRARAGIANMIRDLDAPQRAMPDLPEGTPAPLRTLIQDLLKIPVAREAVDRPGFHRSREDSEVDKVLRLLEDFREGRTGGLRFINEFQDMRGSLPHESQEGRFEADRAIRKAVEALEAMYKENRRSLMPPARQGS